MLDISYKMYYICSMKMIHRTYQFELTPTQEQKTLLDKHFGCIRYVYNHFLNDKQIVKINRWYPSSKTCCECGWINQDLNLSIREWTCKNGHVLDRDLNAAKNILKEGLKIISGGTLDYTDGDGVSLSDKQLSVKSEAQPIGSAVGG